MMNNAQNELDRNITKYFSSIVEYEKFMVYVSKTLIPSIPSKFLIYFLLLQNFKLRNYLHKAVADYKANNYESLSETTFNIKQIFIQLENVGLN